MKSLTESIKTNINERYNSTDERVFWQWIEDLGGTDAIDVINKSSKKEYDDFYKLVSELGTTADEFETFSEIFFDKAGDILSIIENDDPGMSDDSCQYASWSAPFYGQKKFDKAVKSGDWNDLCDQYEGEHCGYAMEDDYYEEWLEKNGVEPKGYAH